MVKAPAGRYLKSPISNLLTAYLVRSCWLPPIPTGLRHSAQGWRPVLRSSPTAEGGGTSLPWVGRPAPINPERVAPFAPKPNSTSRNPPTSQREGPTDFPKLLKLNMLENQSFCNFLFEIRTAPCHVSSRRAINL